MTTQGFVRWRRHPVWVAVTWAAAACWLGPSARAEEGVVQDPEKAQALFAEAKGLYEQGKLRESLEKLKAAHDAYPVDAILLSIVNRHLELGEPEEAAVALGQVKGDDPKLRGSVKKLKSDVQEHLARPVPVSIRANAAEARVSIDEDPFEVLPVGRELRRGLHRFVFQAPGYEVLRLKERVRGSVGYDIRAKLVAIQGSWRLKLDPEAALGEVRVVFDGQQVALTGAERKALVTLARQVKPGTYRIACHRGVDSVVRTEIKVDPSGEAVATCRFPEATAGAGDDGVPVGQVLGWTSFGMGVGSLAVGVGFLASYGDELARYPPPRYKLESSKPVAGGALLATGVAFGVLSALFLSDVISF
jgi:hypothetical protein